VEKTHNRLKGGGTRNKINVAKNGGGIRKRPKSKRKRLEAKTTKGRTTWWRFAHPLKNPEDG